MNTTETIKLVGIIIIILSATSIISTICIISLSLELSKIKKFMMQPFDNKTTNYPDKTLELLQACVLNLENSNNEIKNLKNEIAKIKNDGATPGMKSKTDIHNEQLLKLIKEQNELLQKIYNYTSGEEKKKLAEIIKQASEIMNND